MTDKKMSIIILIAINIFVVFGISCSWLRELSPLLHSLEQQEQAEAVGKRTIKRSHDSTGDPGGPTLYFVTFKFPDGSLKEFEVGRRTSGRKRYEFINEGNTGILTYKEIENIEEKYENEDQYEGRRFIRFEIDPEYGGVKIEKRGLSEMTKLILIFGIPISAIIILVVIGVVIIKKESGS